MKKTLFAILLCGVMILGLTGCIKENNDDDKKSYENNDECCEGCMCGDTIELLKTTETAWTLTKIANNVFFIINPPFQQITICLSIYIIS